MKTIKFDLVADCWDSTGDNADPDGKGGWLADPRIEVGAYDMRHEGRYLDGFCYDGIEGLFDCKGKDGNDLSAFRIVVTDQPTRGKNVVKLTYVPDQNPGQWGYADEKYVIASHLYQGNEEQSPWCSDVDALLIATFKQAALYIWAEEL